MYRITFDVLSRDNKIKAKLGERRSVATSIGINDSRSLEALEERERKKNGILCPTKRETNLVLVR